MKRITIASNPPRLIAYQGLSSVKQLLCWALKHAVLLKNKLLNSLLEKAAAGLLASKVRLSTCTYKQKWFSCCGV